MTEDEETLPDEPTARGPGQTPSQRDATTAGRAQESVAAGVDRTFASEYLDELILAILLRRGEANGMEIIRTFARRFGVQFSPGTVYPHLHSLEEEGLLACRECVQTKEYSIDDAEATRERIDATVTQMSRLSVFLETAQSDD
jgi:DNA-binding transcriptional ArsR family regulator